MRRTTVRRPADTEARRRLRSVTSTSLDVRRTRLSTVGNRAFPVAAARLWNSLPSHVTAAPSLSIFCCHLKSHLFSHSYPPFCLFSHLYSGRPVTRHFGHYNRYYILHFTFLCTQCAVVQYITKDSEKWTSWHVSTECHLPYGITHLPPDTSEHTPLNPSQTGFHRTSLLPLDLRPFKDGG